MRSSVVSFNSASKYPSGFESGFAFPPKERGLVAYAYDPSLDELILAAPDDEDFLHDPSLPMRVTKRRGCQINWRGLGNVGLLILVIAALLALFVLYPVLAFLKNEGRRLLIDENPRINSTGQAPVL
jgi:hypothetical protein